MGEFLSIDTTDAPGFPVNQQVLCNDNSTFVNLIIQALLFAYIIYHTYTIAEYYSNRRHFPIRALAPYLVIFQSVIFGLTLLIPWFYHIFFAVKAIQYWNYISPVTKIGKTLYLSLRMTIYLWSYERIIYISILLAEKQILESLEMKLKNLEDKKPQGFFSKIQKCWYKFKRLAVKCATQQKTYVIINIVFLVFLLVIFYEVSQYYFVYIAYFDYYTVPKATSYVFFNWTYLSIIESTFLLIGYYWTLKQPSEFAVNEEIKYFMIMNIILNCFYHIQLPIINSFCYGVSLNTFFDFLRCALFQYFTQKRISSLSSNYYPQPFSFILNHLDQVILTPFTFKFFYDYVERQEPKKYKGIFDELLKCLISEIQVNSDETKKKIDSFIKQKSTEGGPLSNYSLLFVENWFNKDNENPNNVKLKQLYKANTKRSIDMGLSNIDTIETEQIGDNDYLNKISSPKRLPTFNQDDPDKIIEFEAGLEESVIKIEPVKKIDSLKISNQSESARENNERLIFTDVKDTLLMGHSTGSPTNIQRHYNGNSTQANNEFESIQTSVKMVSPKHIEQVYGSLLSLFGKNAKATKVYSNNNHKVNLRDTDDLQPDKNEQKSEEFFTVINSKGSFTAKNSKEESPHLLDTEKKENLDNKNLMDESIYRSVYQKPTENKLLNRKYKKDRQYQSFKNKRDNVNNNLVKQQRRISDNCIANRNVLNINYKYENDLEEKLLEKNLLTPAFDRWTKTILSQKVTDNFNSRMIYQETEDGSKCIPIKFIMPGQSFDTEKQKNSVFKSFVKIKKDNDSCTTSSDEACENYSGKYSEVVDGQKYFNSFLNLNCVANIDLQTNTLRMNNIGKNHKYNVCFWSCSEVSTLNKKGEKVIIKIEDVNITGKKFCVAVLNLDGTIMIDSTKQLCFKPYRKSFHQSENFVNKLIKWNKVNNRFYKYCHLFLDQEMMEDSDVLKIAIFYFYVQKLEGVYENFKKTVAYDKLYRRLLHFEEITKKAYEL